MIQSKSKYYYTRLDNSGKRIYDSILNAWESHNREPSFIKNPLGCKVSTSKIVEYISYDNPGLFFIDFSQFIVRDTYLKTTIQANYHFSDRQIRDIENQLQNAVANLMSKYPFDKMDQYDKELALHDYLAQTVSYADEGHNNSSASLIGALLIHKAVCEGYAKTYKLLCDLLGISCVVVGGRADPMDRPEESHVWNIVKLNGICSHVDVTWDSTLRTDNDPCYDHFNITDDDIGQDHFWDRNLLPQCSSMKFNYFVRNGSYAAGATELEEFIVSELLAGKRKVYLKCNVKCGDESQVMNKVQKLIANDSRLSKFRYRSMTLNYSPVRNTIRLVFI